MTTEEKFTKCRRNRLKNGKRNSLGRLERDRAATRSIEIVARFSNRANITTFSLKLQFVFMFVAFILAKLLSFVLQQFPIMSKSGDFQRKAIQRETPGELTPQEDSTDLSED